MAPRIAYVQSKNRVAACLTGPSSIGISHEFSNRTPLRHSVCRVSQQEQHRTRTFQEEYRELLHKHRLDFDERYVWD